MKELYHGWTYEPSDFGNGYVLYTPEGNLFQYADGSPVLYPTIPAMKQVIMEIVYTYGENHTRYIDDLNKLGTI